MSYTKQRCVKGHDHWVIEQAKDEECAMACIGILLKNLGQNVELSDIRKASQEFDGGYRPGLRDVVRGDPMAIQAQHMMAAIMRHDEGGVVTQERAGEYGTQATNIASVLSKKYGVAAAATFDPEGAKAAMRGKAKKHTASIALVRWVDGNGKDAGGHFVVIDAVSTHLIGHSEYCIIDPIYGLSTQTLPTLPGHPDGKAPRYLPPNSGGAVGYLRGWHVVTL